MKWVYLPFMFALAFLYTKISYNNFQVEPVLDSQLTSRKPSSAIDKKVEVSPFYKISPLTFNTILVNEDFALFNKVKSYRGTMVGNVNVEGFGYVIDDTKKVSFNVSDFSKVTEGLLFHDVLGHLVSSKFLDKKMTWLDYFEAYKKGLKNEEFPLSFYTEKGMSDAFLDSDKIISENISEDYPFEFTKFKNTYHHIDIVGKNLIQNELKKLYPKVQFFDLLESDSGSKNFQVLARLRPQDKIQWLEIQEVAFTDYDINFNKKKVLDSEKRFELLKKHLYSDSMNSSLVMLKIDKKNFIVKFVEQFKSKIKLHEIPKDDYHDIVMDEAFILGKIHAKSLGEKVNNYIKSWATISVSIIDEQVMDLKFKLIDKEIENIH